MLCDYDYDYAARPEHTALINALYGMPRLNTLSITYFKDLEGIDFSRLPELQQLNIQAMPVMTGRQTPQPSVPWIFPNVQSLGSWISGMHISQRTLEAP